MYEILMLCLHCLDFDRFICFYLLYLLAVRLPCFNELEWVSFKGS